MNVDYYLMSDAIVKLDYSMMVVVVEYIFVEQVDVMMKRMKRIHVVVVMTKMTMTVDFEMKLILDFPNACVVIDH